MAWEHGTHTYVWLSPTIGQFVMAASKGPRILKHALVCLGAKNVARAKFPGRSRDAAGKMKN